VRFTLVRRAVLICTAVLGGLALPASAAAIVPVSEITAPSGAPVYLYGEGGATLAVAGKTNMSNVEIRCYTTASEYLTLEPKEEEPVVPVTAEAFAVTVPQSELPSAPCQLRAVPAKSKMSLPPGVETQFKGPLVVASKLEQLGAGAFYGVSNTLAGSFIFRDAGEYGLESFLYSAAGHADAQLFFGEADLSPLIPEDNRPGALQVDSATGYLPAAAEELEREFARKAHKAVVLSGKLTVSIARAFNEATHQLIVREEDPIVRCSPVATFPATRESCTGFVPTGVTLIRTLESSDEDHVAALSDTWRSSDGAAHAVGARYYMEQAQLSEEGAFEFPTQAAFATVSAGESRTLPAGPGEIFYKERASISEAGNGEVPQGAMLYDAAPNAPLLITIGSGEGKPWNAFELPYQRTVPAGGATSTLRMTFVQSFSLTEARALAASALVGYYPWVAIAAPANGASLTSAVPAVTVSGSAGDALGLPSVTVNGKAVAVSAGGTWSTSVPLIPGANTITATATNQSGLLRSSSVGVAYTPAKPPPASAAVRGGVSGANGEVAFTIACHGAAGTSCTIRATLTTLERLAHGHVTALAAARHGKRVSVGAATATIPAGATRKVTVKLNVRGRKLLRRFGKLPVHLLAKLLGTGPPATLVAKNLTVHPAPRPRRHRR
jgi:hypothetical protein